MALQVLTIEQTSMVLGVSTATIRNWMKYGYIKPLDKSRPISFPRLQIEEFAQKIKSGEIGRLNKRANKSNSSSSFIPDEYLGNNEDNKKVDSIIKFITNNNLDTEKSLFVLAIRLLIEKGIVPNISFNEIITDNIFGEKKYIFEELSSWKDNIKSIHTTSTYEYLMNCEVPIHSDILGVIYQSLLTEGSKVKKGSYYTPRNIVESIAEEYVKKEDKVLDPCCGTGQFLLAYATKISNPENIYGYDCDPIAVRIARINLLMFYYSKDFSPHIFIRNTLINDNENTLFETNDDNYDFIATNPPWGMHFTQKECKLIEGYYPEIRSYESFSCFLIKAIRMLKEGGKLSFILPESILNIKVHSDIRKYLLEHTSIIKITHLGRVFCGVFTPVIRLDIKKKKDKNNICFISNNKSYNVPQSRFFENIGFAFNIQANEIDSEIIRKIYSNKYITLKNNAEWALGIVTGNNNKYILKKHNDGAEEIYRGKDVYPFHLGEPQEFIIFEPHKYQQVAPVEKYRAKEKLIYRFISNKLIFAYDNKGKLTLNSANIMIPKIEGYPIKVILALFNSPIYQFLFQKKFSALKVLRSHIEELPLPLWETQVFDTIINFTNDILNGEKKSISKLNRYIMEQFNLTQDEIKCIDDNKTRE
jgi:type I restriction-modification system DNA methylase subunit